MRAGMWLVLIGSCCLIGLGGPEVGLGQSARVPSGRPALFGTGLNHTDIKNVPIDTSKAVAPVPGIQQGPLNKFSLTSLMSFMGFSGPNTTRGVSPLPAPSTFPSTKYPNTFKPMLPIDKLPAPKTK